MLRKHQNIKIFDGNTSFLKFEITLVTDITIVTSRNELTDTALVTFPNNLAQRSRAIDQIQIGDRIEIRLGYFPNLTLEFSGFINFVNKGSPLQLQCEDEAFLLKRVALPATNFPDTTISEVVNRFYSGRTRIVDAQIGDIRLAKGATLIKFFDLLRSKYSILSFFQQGILKINTSLTEDNTARTFLIHEQRNVPMGTTRLDFQNNNDQPIISHGISVQRDGTTIELFATYRDNLLNNDIIVSRAQPLGTLNTLKVPNLTRERLEPLIRRRLPLLFYTGVSGEVTTFGEPSIRHGDTVQYVDDRIPERNGFFRVNAVVKAFTVSGGYKQRVTLGLKTRV